MQTILLSQEEVRKITQQIYENSIRSKVVSAKNIGKLVIVKLTKTAYTQQIA